jgi:hypothetical protein
MDARGELSPVMYLILGMLVLLAILIVIFSLRDKMFGIIGGLFG